VQSQEVTLSPQGRGQSPIVTSITRRRDRLTFSHLTAPAFPPVTIHDQSRDVTCVTFEIQVVPVTATRPG
jgi:hypothetical protein